MNIAVISFSHVVFFQGSGEVTRKLAARYVSQDPRFSGGWVELVNQVDFPAEVQWGRVYPHFSPHEVGFVCEVQVRPSPKPSGVKRVTPRERDMDQVPVI